MPITPPYPEIDAAYALGDTAVPPVGVTFVFMVSDSNYSVEKVTRNNLTLDTGSVGIEVAAVYSDQFFAPNRTTSHRIRHWPPQFRMFEDFYVLHIPPECPPFEEWQRL